MYFITFNDQPSGIYQSQVIDVVAHLSKMSKTPVTLVSFLPMQNFRVNKNHIKSQWTQSIIIPMFFGISRWKTHRALLKFLTKSSDSAICRGPLATALSLGYYSKVVYDGRAAVKAEVVEYDVTGGNKKLGNDFIEAEKKSVLQSDFRIAVSKKLVEYWGKEYNYSNDCYVVIPCTLSEKVETTIKHSEEIDIVKVVYSGSTSGWQSFDKVVLLLEDLIQRQSNLHVLFLTTANDAINKLIYKYPEKISAKFVPHKDVSKELSYCDYGILIRDEKTTNKVASPVKFAEYLNAGLQVLISPHIGDFSEFVINNNCGKVIQNKLPVLEKVNYNQRIASKNLVNSFLSKDSSVNTVNYNRVINFLKE
jgi:hypothetical protein